MTPDERHTIDAFKVNISLIQTGADGFPLAGQGLELDILGRQVLKIDTICRAGDTAEKQALLNMADAASRMVAAMASGDRDPAIPAAWFKARAELGQIEPED